MPDRLITYSELSTLFMCPTKHQFQYERMLVPKKRIVTLDESSAGHHALEVFYKGGTKEEAIAKFDELYDIHVKSIEDAGWNPQEAVERFLRVRAATLAYLETTAEEDKKDFEFTHVEEEFAVPIFDPKGKRVPGVKFAGKMDGIWTRTDGGGKTVMEHKFLGQFDESRNTLMLDLQLTLYALAARIAFEVDVPLAFYNVVKKPRFAIKKDESKHDFFWRVYEEIMKKREDYMTRVFVTRSERNVAYARKLLYHGAMIITGRTPLPFLYRNVGLHCNLICAYKEPCFDETPAMIENLFNVKEKRHAELSVPE